MKDMPPAYPAPPANTLHTWQRPRWVNTALMSTAWFMLVAYGSLLPFNFEPIHLTQHADGFGSALISWLTSPRWVATPNVTSSLGLSATASDLLLNLALYVPFGMLMRLTLTNRRWRSLPAWLGASLLVAGTSWLMECTQSLTPDRVASLADFWANSLPGIAGAAVAVRVRSGKNAFLFWIYTKIAHPLHTVLDHWLRLRQRPWIMFGLVMLNLALIGFFFISNTAATTANAATTINWLPFRHQFEHAYDVAALVLGRAILVYCLIGALVALTMLRHTARQRLGVVVLLMGLLAVGIEIQHALTPNRVADITEPLLAICGAGFLITTIYLLIHAVRCSCRRKNPHPVTVERRRRPHDYRFAMRR